MIVIFVLACIILVMGSILYHASQKEKWDNELQAENEKLYPIGLRVTAQDDEIGAIVIRKGMSGIVKQVGRYDIVIKFDDMPYECNIPIYVIRER